MVVIARAKHPIPSRTRPLSAAAPMVLRLKTWESRSPPNLERNSKPQRNTLSPSQSGNTKYKNQTGAGWSSPVARQAHNLKAAGSNPAPATSFITTISNTCKAPYGGLFTFAHFTSTPHQRSKRPAENRPCYAALAPRCKLWQHRPSIAPASPTACSRMTIPISHTRRCFPPRS